MSDRLLHQRSWIGEEVSWKRSGSGSYREISRIEIPQSKAEIEAFAAENRFVIEWRGKIPSRRCGRRHEHLIAMLRRTCCDDLLEVEGGPSSLEQYTEYLRLGVDVIDPAASSARRSGSGCRPGP